MQIGIQTWGSHGDIRPFLALAARLRAAGHMVTLNITSVDGKDYGGTAKALDINLQPVASPVIKDPQTLIDIGTDIIFDRRPLRQARKILTELFEPVVDEMLQAAMSLCQSSDVIIGHFFHYPVQAAALKTGTPYVSVALMHGVTPTALRPPIGLPDFGQISNRLFWGVLRTGLNRFLRPYVNRIHRQLGLPAAGDILTTVWASRELNLIAVSPAFCQRPVDWGTQHKVCGFFDTGPVQNEGEISDALQQFLRIGPAPVFMGFGSMLPQVQEIQQETIDIFMAAVKRVGCRAIIQASMWQDCKYPADENYFFVNACPHRAVFPRCAAVVHHGGSGTTQTATQAGVPSIVVAHIGEQEAWGHELRRLGLAPALIRRRKLSSALLADRMRRVLDSPAMQVQARRIGDQLRSEDGVGRAMEYLETYFNTLGR